MFKPRLFNSPVFLLLVAGIGCLRSAEAVGDEPGTSAEAGPSSSVAAPHTVGNLATASATSAIIDPSDDDEAQLRALIGQLPWCAYMAISGLDWSIRFHMAPSIEVAVAEDIVNDLMITSNEVSSTDDAMSTDEGQRSARNKPRYRDPSKSDFHKYFQSRIGHPCADLRSLSALYSGVIAKYLDRKANDYSGTARRSSGSTTMVIEDMRDMAATCERIQREVSMEVAYERLREMVREMNSED